MIQIRYWIGGLIP